MEKIRDEEEKKIDEIMGKWKKPKEEAEPVD